MIEDFNDRAKTILKPWKYIEYIKNWLGTKQKNLYNESGHKKKMSNSWITSNGRLWKKEVIVLQRVY